MPDQLRPASALRPALVLVPRSEVAFEPERSAPRAEPEPTPPLPAPDGVSFLPGEDVLLLAVAFPAMSAAQRRAAAAFAVEDMIAQPLEEVHVVVGPQTDPVLAPGVWLVAVVSHAVMEATPGRTRLLPDTLALPMPEPGAWSVHAAAGRVLVRRADGAGFATSPAALAHFWAADGSPKIVLYGGALPAGVPVARHAARPPLPDAALVGFDLRTGRHARHGAGATGGIRGLAAVLAVAVAGHLGLLTLDVIALGEIAAAREAALRTTLGTPSGNLDAALADALALRQPAASGGFLPLLSRALGAAKAEIGAVQVQDMRFAAADNSLVLTLEAPDIATLQRLETAFAGAGLAVSAGAATSGNGAAEAQMTLRAGMP